MATCIQFPPPPADLGVKPGTQRWFAELDRNNTVLRVVVVGKQVLTNEAGAVLEFPESEPVGQEYLNNLLGPNEFGETRIWKQTSSMYLAREDDPTLPVTPLQTDFRGAYARVGGQYDPVNDIFT